MVLLPIILAMDLFNSCSSTAPLAASEDGPSFLVASDHAETGQGCSTTGLSSLVHHKSSAPVGFIGEWVGGSLLMYMDYARPNIESD